MAILQYRFLMGDEKWDTLWLLGFPLALTPTERRILFAMLREQPATAEALSESLPRPMKPHTLAVHIHAVNQKALAVSGRRLIECSDGTYRFSDHL